MPAYVSHAIMAEDVYLKLDDNVSKEYMLTYSLGGDLARFSKCRRISHKMKTEEFIDNMWLYIKENNLSNDGDYLGVLYGHICHYYMDCICHPLIRKIDKLSIDVGFKKHTLIEGYIDSYLVKLKYNLDIKKYNTKYIFNGKLRKIYKMINDVYYKTYGVKYLSFSYWLCIIMYKNIRTLFVLFGKGLLIKISRFDKYIKVNNKLDILNNSKEIKYKNYNGDICNDSFMELYYQSIDKSLCRIKDLK